MQLRKNTDAVISANLIPAFWITPPPRQGGGWGLCSTTLVWAVRVFRRVAARDRPTERAWLWLRIWPC